MSDRRFSTSPASLVRTLWAQRELVSELVRRDIAGRYRGSALGALWSLAAPLLLLAAFTLVFGVVFPSRWGTAPSGTKGFALLLFPGILIHALLAEPFGRAPLMIASVPNYVKKVVFPLELLPVVAVATALFHALLGFAVLMLALVVLGDGIPITAVALPLVLAPLLLVTVGVTWLFAALGVYLRDIAQITGLVTMLLMFISPVFYPVSALPPAIREWITLNPLTIPLESARDVLVFGHWPDWGALALYSVVAMLVMWGGYWWFQRSRKGFADVL
jgi:lipopolysaccharide transport system permease protein